MSKEELLNLLHSEDFIAELNDADGIEGIQGVFKNKKIDIDEKKAKIVMDALKIANEKMYNCESIEDNSLDDVSGGAEIKIAKVILFIVLTVLVINLVLNFLIFPVRQTSVSMLPDFTKNSCIFFTPLKKSFERGDVVLLSSNDTENLSFFEQILDSVLSFFSARQFSYAKREHYMGNQEKIRRIIALPGDSIYMRDYIVYIKPKGEKHYLTEYEIIKKTYNINVNVAPSSWDSSIGVYGSFDEIVLGEDEYFVLGDNRNSSVDSRLTGPVKKQGIKASSVFQFFPLSKIKIL